jgi:hypothetical protein
MPELGHRRYKICLIKCQLSQIEDFLFKIINSVAVELESLKPQITKASIEHGLELLPHISHPQNPSLTSHNPIGLQGLLRG